MRWRFRASRTPSSGRPLAVAQARCLCHYFVSRFQNGLRGGNQITCGDAAQKLRARLVRADEDAEFSVRRQPLAEARIGPEPRDRRRVGHHRQMERPGVAAKMQRAVLDDGGKLHQIQIAGEHAPRFLRQQAPAASPFSPARAALARRTAPVFFPEIFRRARRSIPRAAPAAVPWNPPW